MALTSASERATPPPSLGANAALPLASLRETLDDGAAECRWTTHPSGIPGRVLVQPLGAPITLPLRLENAVLLRARVRLLQREWLDGNGTLRVSVRTSLPDRSERTIWSGVLHTAIDHVSDDGLEVVCEIPATATALILGTERVCGTDARSIAHGIWVEPELVVPGFIPLTAGRGEGLRSEVPRGQEPRSETLRSEPRSKMTAPLISVVTPVHDPPPAMLEEAIASVLAQTFADWELCLVDDGSRNPDVIETLRRRAAADPRIHLRRREEGGGISSATNHALEFATGEYVALLDHDDTLEPGALQLIADALARNPTLDMVYTDEAIVVDGRTIGMHIKPDWAPDTLRTNCYTCHLGVYRRALLEEIGGFRSEFDGAQDFDMILRLTELTDRIAHLPRATYNWRAHLGSAAGGDAKPYAYVAGRNALASHVQRVGIDADVEFGPTGIYRIVHRVGADVSVAVVMAVTEVDRLAETVQSLTTQPHLNWTIVLAGTPDRLSSATEIIGGAGVGRERVRTVPLGADDPPESALATAAGAAVAADADHLLLARCPFVGLTHDWLRRLLGYSNQPGIAAAGPVVLDVDGLILHAGVALPNGLPLHLLYGRAGDQAPVGVTNVSALDGVLVTPRRVYAQLGGLRAERGDLTLIDFSLRALDSGWGIVSVPDARLAADGAHITNDVSSIWRLRRERGARWHERYYSRHYRPDRGDYRLITEKAGAI